MFGGLDPKKMQTMMKQMGISQEEIDASKVIIECSDKNIVINNPSVIKIKMQGQESFQITGDVSKEIKEENTEEDIKIIMEKTGVSEDIARSALEKAEGNLTEALIELG
jgi:nascent polypeptide-associated complex subunit alpha